MKKRYDEFRKLLSFYGFIDNEIISFEQYEQAIAKGVSDGQLYIIACDVNAGFDFSECLKGLEL